MGKYVASRDSAVKMNEVRGRFISALRQYPLNGTELRIAIALNDLYNPELLKAWPSQAYLCQALADVATGRPMPDTTLRDGLRGLKKAGIIETKMVRLAYNHSKLEYHIAYDKIIGCDAGYPKGRQRGPITGIQKLILQVPSEVRHPTVGSPTPYRRDSARYHRDSDTYLPYYPSLGPPIESAVGKKKDSFNLKKERGNPR